MPSEGDIGMGLQGNTTRRCSSRRTAIGTAAITALLAAQNAAAEDAAAPQPYHDALTNHVPGFITAPGQTDILFIIVIVFLLAVVLVIGNLYFQLHAVPERIAHKTNKVQMEIVAVLALISLFTHNHIYWIIGLLLAFIRIPDFSTPIYSIARSMARLANRDPAEIDSAAAPVAHSPTAHEPPAPAPVNPAPVHSAPVNPAPAAAAPIAAAPSAKTPTAGAPIAPVPAASHPQPSGQTNAQQPAENAMRTGPHERGI
ncbi:hypothetical protein [Rhizobium sp. BK379]|uniref:hypothetical protein n=1 Tax=Rhizobium sp. BK379 TaxID=2587059 RepID=UPI0016080BFD|nr:hypothetical protein [Rhizobium sp. BK379]